MLFSAEDVRDARALTSTTPSPEDFDDKNNIDLKDDAANTPVEAGKSQYELDKAANIKRNKELLLAMLDESPISKAGGVAEYIAGVNGTDGRQSLARYGFSLTYVYVLR